jgi:hypothetical protein
MPESERSEAERRLDELREHPERAISPEQLIKITRERFHADLCFPGPFPGDSRGIFDYSSINIPFPTPADLELPEQCRIDLSRIKELSKQFASAINKPYEPWTYDWFYLELLSAEEKLIPRVWASYEAFEAGIPILDNKLIDDRTDQASLDSAHEQATQWWELDGDRLLEKGALQLSIDHSWLYLLELDNPLEIFEMSLIPPLTMSKIPLYLYPQDCVILAREMRTELYSTSIFCHKGSAELRDLSFQIQRNRFAIKLPRCGWGEANGGREEIDKRDEEIWKKWKSGMKVRRIANEMSVVRRTVYDALKRYKKNHPEETARRTDDK